jgi:hypothetical protein
LHGIAVHGSNGERQGLQGPPPQAAQWATAPSATCARESKSPMPSELAPRNLKSSRRFERRASARAAATANLSLIL